MKTLQDENTGSAISPGSNPADTAVVVGGVKGSLRGRFMRGAFWSLAGSVVSRGLTMAAGIFVARMLVKEQFGEFGIIVSTTAMFQMLAGVGMGMTAAKHVAEFRTRDPGKAGRILALSGAVSLGAGGVVAGLFFFCAPWLAESTLAAPHLAPLLRIASLLLLFSTLDGVQTGALAGFEEFKTIALFQLIGGALSFPLILGGVYFGGLSGAVWGVVGSYGVNCGLNHLALRRALLRGGVILLFRDCGREWRVLLSFSLPVMIAGTLGTPVLWACNAMLVNRPDGYSEMALISAALYWRALLLFIPSTVNRITVPILSNSLDEWAPRRIARVMLYNISFNGAVTLIPAVVIALLASQIMGAYGPEFTAGSMVLLLFAASAVLAALVNSMKEFLVAAGKTWLYFGLIVYWSGAMLLATYALVGRGAWGVALANVIAYGMLLLAETFFLLIFLRTLKQRGKGDRCTGPTTN